MLEIEKVVEWLTEISLRPCDFATDEFNSYDTEHLANEALEICEDAKAFCQQRNEAFAKLKEYEKLSQVLFKIEKYFKIKDLEFLVNGIENGSIVVLQDDGHFIGSTPIKETTIKIRRM